MPTSWSQRHPCGCNTPQSPPMFGVSRPTFYLQLRKTSRNSSSPRFKLSLHVSSAVILCCRHGKERGMRAEDFCPLFILPSSNLWLSSVVDWGVDTLLVCFLVLAEFWLILTYPSFSLFFEMSSYLTGYIPEGIGVCRDEHNVVYIIWNKPMPIDLWVSLT